MPTVTIGIPSYNEASNLRLLLDRINLNGDETTFRIIEIIISDDSTDSTANIVQQYVKTHYESNIRFFHHNHRRGAANAWNEIISKAKGNVIVMYDADVIPEKNCTSHLVSCTRNNYGLCASNPQPLSGKGIPARASAFVGSWLESVRKRQLSQYTVMGRGFAIQSHIAKKVKIPSGVIAIDLFLQQEVIKLGYRITFNPLAKVLFKPASTLEDFSSQILRANRGHSQLEELQGKLKYNLERKTVLIEGLRSIVKDPIGAASLAISSMALPYYLFKIKDFNSSIWHTAQSTKNIPHEFSL
jgi:cellulose synthase/poly-beta-1,6-N-acetylglucosamine synthase-like glycosyltransferase